jgi:hypothetical protein
MLMSAFNRPAISSKLIHTMALVCIAPAIIC